MIYFIIGLVIGILGAYFWMAGKKSKASNGIKPEEKIDLPELYETKAENIAKLKEHLKSVSEITNDDVQSLLKVSDATAVRYLDELEKEGIIKQVGKTGKYTYYEKL